MGSVEAAKAYLMKANGEGCNLYDHLAEVMSKLLSEKPEDALAQLEAIRCGGPTRPLSFPLPRGLVLWGWRCWCGCGWRS
eukprot:COSAG02_NODE_477_length_21523_cov_11.763163_21_plen_80_part_00